jgi:ferredoxin
MSTRISIDWTRCDGRGLCHELLPELLTADDWGYPLSRNGDPSPRVPAPLREHAEQAVLDCPRLALRLIDAPDAQEVPQTRVMGAPARHSRR